MNTTHSKLIFVGILLLVAIAGYFTLKILELKPDTQSPDTNIQIENSGENISKMPLSSLINKEGSYECSWSHPSVDNSQMIGSMFIHNSMVLIELKAIIGSATDSAFFLARDGYIYEWNSGRPSKGHQSKISDQDPNPKIGYLIMDDGLSKDANYNCKIWETPTNSKFEIPSLYFSGQ